MNAILHKNNDGSNAITYVAKGNDIKKIQAEVGGVEISSQDENINVDFINAYIIVNGSIKLNLDKARDIKLSLIRQKRDTVFLDFDKEYDIAIRDEVDLTILKEKRQYLKDIPQKAEVYLNSCISLDEVDNLKIESLS